MKVLVTGGSGFIGRYLVRELLGHGYEVRVLTRNPSAVIEGAEVSHGDITDVNTILPALEGIDAVFHNAAYATDWGKKDEIYKANVEGTKNVAGACMTAGVDRMVFTSSAGIYGFPNSDREITEESHMKPLNTYHKSKLDAETALEKFDGLRVSAVRPPLVLGAGAKAAEIILSRIEQKNMTYIGSGSNKISIAHPADVGRCLRLALEAKRDGAYNVVSFVCTIRELFEEIAASMGAEPPRKHVPYPVAYIAAFFSEMFSKSEPSLTRFRVKSLGTTRSISCEKAVKELGYKPEFDMPATVEDMVSWYGNRK